MNILYSVNALNEARPISKAQWDKFWGMGDSTLILIICGETLDVHCSTFSRRFWVLN
jgi:hypothetical protein